jgi:cell division protein FtsZ
MDNNRLLEFAPHLPLEQAFSVIDQIIAEIILGITETLTRPSLINLDYADVRTIMRTGGPSIIIVGEGRIKNGPEKIVQSALKNPLLEVDCRGAKACLLHLTGGTDMTLKEAAAVTGSLTRELDLRANVIWGARIRPNYMGKIRLMAIITGVKSPQVLGPKESCVDLLPEIDKNVDTIDHVRIDVIK